MMSWYSASTSDTGAPSGGHRRLRLGSGAEAPERQCLEAVAHRCQLELLEDIGGEGIREQLACGAAVDAATQHVELRRLVDPAHGGAVRALHVVGEDLQLRL